MVALNNPPHPEITIEINPDMPLDNYCAWNIDNAADILVRKPEERRITLSVFALHRKILEGRGAPKALLDSCDDLLLEQIERARQYYREHGVRENILSQTMDISLEEIRSYQQ
jgi:hypothetical protein